MTALLIGFDSAWTPGNSGALIAALRHDDGSFQELGPPRIVNFPRATEAILQWQSAFLPRSTIVLLDQPTIVRNLTGQRPVENIVSSAVSLRYGGMQPANTAREEMFGSAAPLWPFLNRFGGAADLLLPGSALVIETYPVLAMIALGWMLPDSRPAGCLPKYNPERRSTFSVADWRFVCQRASAEFHRHGLTETAQWLDQAAIKASPRESDQDGLDACICLLVALHFAAGGLCLMVGNQHTGYIVAPHCSELHTELETRCVKTNRVPSEWLRVFRHSPTGDQEEIEVQKPYHQMTPAERAAARIEKNREIERKPVPRISRWSLEGIVAQLNTHRQRASYGAVAGIVGGLARGLMNGRTKCPEYSWVVAASGPERGYPTGYSAQQIHPDCLRQIQQGSQSIIDTAEDLKTWLDRH